MSLIKRSFTFVKNINFNEPDNLDLKGLRVSVIGGTGGLGRALSRFMASRGAKVWVVGRTFQDAGVPNIEFIQADLSLMSEARRVSALLPVESLDMCIFTTGILAAPQRQETAEGIEKDMAVSFLSRKVVIDEISGRLGSSTNGGQDSKPRVFIMGFPGKNELGYIEDMNAEKSYAALKVHMNTVAGT